MLIDFIQGQGDRVFYESLYNQKPDSFMALKWCIEYGVFDEEKAKKEFAVFIAVAC